MIKNKLSFELILSNEDKLEELEELMRLANVQTKTEFVSSAISLMKWAIEARRKGRVIASINEKDGTYRELQTPCIDEAFKHPYTGE